jgi:molybdate transport system substrate-binding protein
VPRPVVPFLLLALAALASGRVAAAPSARITVYGATSLTDVFPRIDRRPRYSFAGSNTLAAQIQQGAPADVFASADTKLPAQLFASKDCSRPVVFARNRLVIVVPKSNPANVRSVYDLTRDGIKLVIADAGVPVGGYTLQLLKNMNLTTPVLANVVSRETDVREVLAKVALGEADAGFVYATDAKADSGRVKVVKLPAKAQPRLQYGICVVSSSAHKKDARAFVAKVLSKPGQAQLRRAGFLAPVRRS